LKAIEKGGDKLAKYGDKFDDVVGGEIYKIVKSSTRFRFVDKIEKKSVKIGVRKISLAVIKYSAIRGGNIPKIKDTYDLIGYLLSLLIK